MEDKMVETAIRRDDSDLREVVYDNIVKLYDYGSELVDFAEIDALENEGKKLDLVEPVINGIEDFVKVLVVEYRLYAKSGKVPDRFTKKKIYALVKNLRLSIKECKTKI